MIRSAFAATAAVAATLAIGVGGAVAAPSPDSPLTRVAAHAGVSVPPLLARALTKRFGAAPDAALAPATTPSGTDADQQQLQASDGMPLDLFGWTVSLTADGHTALVGAPGRLVGAAYVFVERGGTWTEQQELQSPAGSAMDSYGWSVSLSGDGLRALVGAFTGNATQGIVYSYVREGDDYVLDGQITAPDQTPSSTFGASVSLSGLGNVALIGAPGHNSDQGAAYVFVRREGSWKLQREFQDTYAPVEDYGYSVSEAADGTTGVVGAPLADGGQGAAYALDQFDGSQQRLVGSSAVPTGFFGYSVSMNALGCRLLVGSPFANSGNGGAYLFDRSGDDNAGNGWIQTQELVQSNPSGTDAFGSSVALDYPGNVALIGAEGRNGGVGGAFTFVGGSKLHQQRELMEPTPSVGDEYGFSAAIDAIGDELLIGAPYRNDAQGAAWAVDNSIG